MQVVLAQVFEVERCRDQFNNREVVTGVKTETDTDTDRETQTKELKLSRETHAVKITGMH